MKQFLSGILASSLMLSMTTTTFATESLEINPSSTAIETKTLSESADFTINSEGVLTKYTGSGGDVVIPTSVRSIGAEVFKGNTSLESVTIPSSLQRIESSAFSGCSNLRVVDLGEGVQYIGASAFADTTALSLIWFPSTLTEIGSYAFSNSALTKLYVPATVTNLGEYVFQNCTRLTSVLFMGNMTTLPRATFYKCVVLEDVYLREGITTLGRSAFNACTSLKNITFPSTLTSIGQYAMYGCSKLETLDFSNTRLQTVDYYAFQHCISLREAIFPYGCTTFSHGYTTLDTDKGQFIGCTSLEKVVVPSTLTSTYFRFFIPNIHWVATLLNILSNDFENINHPFIDCNPNLVVYGYSGADMEKLATFTDLFTYTALPAESENKNPVLVPTTTPQLPSKSKYQVVLPVVSEGENAHASAGSDFVLGAGGIITSYKGNGGHVEIPSSIDGRVVYGIGSGAFQGKTNVESVTLPRTVERIESSAFSGCTNLRTVNLNEGLQYIGVSAFASTTSLSSIWFPATLVELGEKAFDNAGLTSLYLPETVRIMGEYAFQSCSRLRSVIFMANLDTLPRATFYNCAVLDDVYLREGIVTIGRSAFNLCTSLEEITLPTTTKSIGEYAFYGCSKLKKMDMSNTRLSYVDFYAFQNCISLTEVIFPYGFRTLAYGETSMDTDKAQFKGCSSLVKVVVPSTIDTCYYYYTFINYSHLNHPFIDCNPGLVVYGYEGTCIGSLAGLTKDVTFSLLGDRTGESKPTIVPTTPPTLPTKPSTDIVVPQITPEENLDASPASDFTIGDGGVITSYTGSGGEVVIPSSINGRAVYGIGSGVFQGNTKITSVTMPSTLERIESSAFSGCTNLRTVVLNEGLQYIGNSAFSTTTSLSSIWFPTTVEELGGNSFEKSGLTSLYVPATVRILGEYAFQECSSLASVIFMGDMDTLPRATFYNCTILSDVYLREGIVTIGRSAFHLCTSLVEITLPSTTKSIGQFAFYACSNLKKMDLSNTQLSYMDYYAFQNCTSLTEVIFPYGFRTFAYGETSMDTDKAQFKGCSSLVKVVLPSTLDTCYHYYRFINYSHLNHPFAECHPDLVVYGYSNTCLPALASLTNGVTFSSLGDLSGEDKSAPVPTSAPTLPTSPYSSTTTTTPTTTPESSSYPAWASSFIDFVSADIMPDISTSNYNDSSSRGLIAQSLYNMAGKGANVSASHSFSDVGNFATAIAWCHTNTVMSGTSETEFGTNSNVTREQFALILMQAASVLGKNTVAGSDSALSDFPDVDSISFWAKDGMTWAVANGLMSGSEGNLNPKGNITRTEVAVMLYSFDQL